MVMVKPNLHLHILGHAVVIHPCRGKLKNQRAGLQVMMQSCYTSCSLDVLSDVSSDLRGQVSLI